MDLQSTFGCRYNAIQYDIAYITANQGRAMQMALWI